MAEESQQEKAQREKAALRGRGFRPGRPRTATGNARGAGVPPPRRQKPSIFGPPVGARPDVLTDAETVMLPKFSPAAVQFLRPEPPTRPDAQAPAGKPADKPAGEQDQAPARADPPAAAPGDPGTPDDSREFLERAIKAAEEFLARLDRPDQEEDETAGHGEHGTGASSAEAVPDPVTAADLPAVEVLPADATVDEATINEAIVVIEPDATTELTVVTEPVAAEAVARLAPSRRDRLRRRPAGPATAREFEYPYVPTRRRTRLYRLVLLGILALQALLALRLQNTAFEDEALYLYAGQMELEHLLHGTALQGSYAAYFSGAPVLYPVLAAMLNDIGGLALARGLSLVEMLATTALLYSLTRRLFNERTGLLAAAMFSVAEAVSFVGSLATYDATCLFLLALGAWIMVRTAGNRRPLFLLAAPVVALAVAVKYAGALFVPTIALLVVLAGWPALGRRVLIRPVLFGAVVGALLYGGLLWGGPLYHDALSSTTTNRVHGTTPVTTLLRETLNWGGIVIGLAVIGTICYTRRVRMQSDEGMAPAGARFRRLTLGVLLTGTALLAPAYQAHLHTDVSLEKHIGFGLFFAAPMAGVGLGRLIGDHVRRPQIGIFFWCAALVLGMVQAQGIYHVWANSSAFVSAFSRYLKPNARYLVEVPEVPIYYLEGHSDAQPYQFTSTYNITYYNAKSQAVTGSAGYQQAIAAGYFQVVAYNDQTTPATDAVIEAALRSSGKYYQATQVRSTYNGNTVTYTIWVKGHAPAKAGTAKARTAKGTNAKGKTAAR